MRMCMYIYIYIYILHLHHASDSRIMQFASGCVCCASDSCSENLEIRGLGSLRFLSLRGGVPSDKMEVPQFLDPGILTA